MSRTVFQFAANSYHMGTVNPTLKKVLYFVEEEGRVVKETVHTFPLSRKSDEDLDLSRRGESMTMLNTAEATICHLI